MTKSMETSKLVIIGAQGMLGSMLGRVLADWQPVLWDKNEIDITNERAVKRKLGELQPRVIINAAAYTDVDGAEKDQATAMEVNGMGVQNIAAVGRELKATVVHYSTDYVFSGKKEEGYTENDVPGGPVNVYGQSKLAGEQALAASGVSYYLIRTAWLYGPGGKNFVETMLALGEKQSEVSVVNDQWGCPTYTKDVAYFTQMLLSDKQYGPGIYHAVNTGKASWYDFATEIFLLANKKVTVKQIPAAMFERPADRPRYSVLQNTKGPAMRAWEVALDDYLTEHGKR